MWLYEPPPLAANLGSLLVLALKARHLLSPVCKGRVREAANQPIILFRWSPAGATYTPIGRASRNESWITRKGRGLDTKKPTMHFLFQNIITLADGDLRLQLAATEIDTSGEEPLPTYRFRMINANAVTPQYMGFINLRIGFGTNITLYRGHIGYGVDEQYRGNRYAERACRLLLPVAKFHGVNPVWITCNPDNIASRRTCERLGTELVETITVPENTEAYRAGGRVKCRYRVELD